MRDVYPVYLFFVYTLFGHILFSFVSVQIEKSTMRESIRSNYFILIIFFLIQHWHDNFMNYTKSFREQFIFSSTFTWTDPIIYYPINIFFSSWNSQTLKAVSHFEAFWLHLLASILFGLAI